MTREEAINEINKVFTSAYANYIVTALTEGATVSDIQHGWGRAYEAGVKDGLEQEPCEDAVSRAEVLNLVRLNAFHAKSQIKAIENMPSVTPQEPKTGYISIDDAMSVFDDFMCGDADEESTETFLEMLKDKTESEVSE